MTIAWSESGLNSVLVWGEDVSKSLLVRGYLVNYLGSVHASPLDAGFSA